MGIFNVTRKNELAAINSQKKKNEMVFAEVTTRTIARMKRLVKPHSRFLRDNPSICSIYSEKIESNTCRYYCNDHEEKRCETVDKKREG